MNPVRRHPMDASRLTLLSESLLLGVLIFLASLPLVTAFTAMTAGCALLRDREDVSVGLRPYARRFVAVARTGPLGFAVPIGVGAVLLADWVAVTAGLPGHAIFAVLLPLPAAVIGALALRSAAAWRPGATWPRIYRSVAGADIHGTVLLVMAVAVALVICSTFPVVTPLAAGQLALAAVAVDARVRP